jgi:hypothetical protein
MVFIFFIPLDNDTSEDLKWNAPIWCISIQHWNLTLAEIKCPILFLQGFKTPTLEGGLSG